MQIYTILIACIYNSAPEADCMVLSLRSEHDHKQPMQCIEHKECFMLLQIKVNRGHAV